MTAHHAHHTRRWAAEAGYCAACRCGWRTTRRTRELRDRDADAHEIGSIHPPIRIRRPRLRKLAEPVTPHRYERPPS
jgi:hypothetical protein